VNGQFTTFDSNSPWISTDASSQSQLGEGRPRPPHASLTNKCQNTSLTPHLPVSNYRFDSNCSASPDLTLFARRPLFFSSRLLINWRTSYSRHIHKSGALLTLHINRGSVPRQLLLGSGSDRRRDDFCHTPVVIYVLKCTNLTLAPPDHN
jgi:hypothetical protein